MTQMLGAFAEFERAMIRERTMNGLAHARSAGRHLGRRPSLTGQQRAEIVARAEAGQGSLAACQPVSRVTLYRAARVTGTSATSIDGDQGVGIASDQNGSDIGSTFCMAGGVLTFPRSLATAPQSRARDNVDRASINLIARMLGRRGLHLIRIQN